MHLKTIEKPLPKCSQHVTDDMQPNILRLDTSSNCLCGGVGSRNLQYTSTTSDSGAWHTCVYMCWVLYDASPPSSKNIVVTTRHVTDRIFANRGLWHFAVREPFATQFEAISHNALHP